MRDSIPGWQHILAEGFTSARQLLSFLQLPAHEGSVEAEKQFRTRVPRGFAARMQPGNRHDPLLLQVLAVSDELVTSPGFVQDPLDEAASNAIPGLIHKYHGRVLLTVTGACAINCRYCFRRHFPYQENNPGRKGWKAVVDYIAADETIHEVIFSGGDPLLANDAILAPLIGQLSEIPHLQVLRIHTRIPVVLPERVDDGLIEVLDACRLKKVVVLHTNHPRELNEQVMHACRKLQATGCVLLNQSVLLAGINDNVETLAELSHGLFAFGVLPYYLHILDKVEGAVHFDVSTERALDIFRQLQSVLPGYLVPRLAREKAGEKHKTLLA